MIEVIYKEEKQEAKGNEGVFCVPRNIRQIGLADENYRIYVEDYVYTFLNKQAETSQETAGRVAVLTGETKWSKGVSYLFVRGALTVEDMEASAEHIDFTDEIWERIYEEKTRYFPEHEIVGWFFAGIQVSGEQLPDVFARAHLKHFGGEKVLMLMDVSEREEAFFRYENDHMTKQRGYYIFYEKNLQMQTYMVEKNQGVQVDVPDETVDKAVRTFRKIIQEKKEEKSQEAEGKTSVFSYAATACLAIAVLTVGVNFYRGYNIPQSEPGLEQSRETSAKPETQEESETLTSISKAQPTEAAEKKVIVTVTATPQPEAKANARRETALPEEAETESAQTESVYSSEADERKERKVQEPAVDEGQDEVQKDMQMSGQEQETENQEQPASAADVHSSYVIRPGDTLYDISVAKYGNMEIIGEICRLNGFSEDEVIYPGQVIVLP